MMTFKVIYSYVTWLGKLKRKKRALVVSVDVISLIIMTHIFYINIDYTNP